MSFNEISYSSNEGVAVITLNRPEKLNAWTRVMAGEVWEAMGRASDDEGVRAVVLTGAGRGFCAGADMSELEGVSAETIRALDPSVGSERRFSILSGDATAGERDPANCRGAREDFRKRYSYLSAVPKPVIAAINGPAAGVGLILGLHCDLRFASENARFSTAFSKRGLIAEHGIGWLLPRLIGHSNALDLLYSSRVVGAEEALRLGLVNRVVPGDKLLDETLAYAADLASNVSPRSLRVMKRQIYEAQFQTFADASEASDEEMLLSLQSEDFKEGVAHFVEKRAPRFTGRSL
ncbi:MAG: enoyl-CoA hydratase [Deltaproteobacteria bacterium]|nr:enoyl-CoA hydratase [Deltaproteobacteria bacterium]